MPEKAVVKISWQRGLVGAGVGVGGGGWGGWGFGNEDITVLSSSEACWSSLPIEFDTMMCR